MTLFISYARRDAPVVTELHADLERSRQRAWFDRELEGGQQWWDAVLEQIRACDLFVFVLSPDSVRSRACRAELAYAVALNRPLLPVMVRDVNVELAPDPIGMTHVVDYRERTTETAIALLMGVTQSGAAVPLPEPLPTPPPAPVTDLGPVRDQLTAETLSFGQQRALVFELKQHVDSVDQHVTLLALLQQFRERADIVESVGREVDALIRAVPGTDEQPWSRTHAGAPRRPLSERDPDSVDRLRALVAHLRGGHLTPILGYGLTDSLIGPRRLLAREWARTFEFPMAKHQQEELTDVAQFVTVMTNADTLRSSLDDYLRTHLRSIHVERADGEDEASLAELLLAAWENQRSPTDPHTVLAGLPCPIYVAAQPWGLLTEALRLAGKEPVVELCRWRPDVYDWPPSIFQTEQAYVPSVDQPLVYHVFGNLDCTESLVITHDDFDDFLIAVAEDKSLIPPPVQRALADSALMLLGFGLEDRDVRVLLRTLISQEGRRKLHKYTHVAAQVDLTTGVMSPARAQRYLERYFGKFREPSLDIFWGTVDEFSADLAGIWRPAS